MRILDKMKQSIRNFLNIQEANDHTILIHELLSFKGNVAKNRIWYRGDSYELDQFYHSIDRGSDGIKFWGANQTTGREMRKIHTGLPSIIADRLTDIIMNDLNQVEFKEDADKDTWNEIEKDNSFEDVLKGAVTHTMTLGDGAFKISLDSDISKYPIIEFYEADNVEYTINRGRIREIIFTTQYTHDKKHYFLKETYGYGYIYYTLYDGDKEVPLNRVPVLANLKPIKFDKTVILAHQLKFTNSSKYKGRGQSIFDKKTDDFDALDEAWSQWMDALRSGRSKEYIPESIVPRNPETGALIKPNAFDNRFIISGDGLSEDSKNEIKVIQPSIPHESYLATYITALDLCLQGLISPSTLGIDMKKLDNADAQREKEKATLYTRGNIVDVLQKQLPLLVDKIFKCISILNKQTLKETVCTVNFGEYANPSFESQVETVGKGKQNGIMSIEASVEELYGDTKDEEWKKQEVMRLKMEQGITTIEEPAVNMEGVVLSEGNSDEPGLPNDKEPGAEPVKDSKGTGSNGNIRFGERKDTGTEK